MDNQAIARRLDGICEQIARAEVLNALHACRPGHPWNLTAEYPWRNAYAMVRALPFAARVRREDEDWLRQRMEIEGDGE
jgi:hypothetical protein